MAVTKGLNISAPVIDKISAQSTTGSTFTTGTWIDMGQFEQVAYRMNVTLGTSNTLDALVNQATSNAGAGSKAITGKALATITNGTASSSTKLTEIIVKASDLDVNSGFRYIKLSATIGTVSNANVISAIAEGADVRTSPQTSTVDQSVS